MTPGFREQLFDGRRAMAHLIHVWHERNGWSHKVLPALAESLDIGRVHNSQISNLRNAKLASPGPEVFLALAQANAVLHEGIETISDRLGEIHPELLTVLMESAIPLTGDDGQPLSAGKLFEIFLGLAPLPSCFDWFIEESESALLSAALAEYLCCGKSWRLCRDEVMSAYPIVKAQRRERFAQVMAGLRDYSAEQLDGELIDLHTTHLTLVGKEFTGSTKEFLDDLRLKVLEMKNQETP
ncbi:hypothetical protein [Prochlorococcus sp. MIT 1307]|uniref:hypothetical protein n=1 Tax=Prochlorococcus sp. MIT 1307 TaxID=3096219 RepID=UPI002A74E921|nr:hypothetical protein [Prochlorococcus sp. MIT 1307]